MVAAVTEHLVEAETQEVIQQKDKYYPKVKKENGVMRSCVHHKTVAIKRFS